MKKEEEGRKRQGREGETEGGREGGRNGEGREEEWRE